MRTVDAEAERDGLGRIGVTALVEDGGHVLVQFGLRSWPDNGSAQDLEWSLIETVNGRRRARRGGGFGGGVSSQTGAAFDGGWWFEGGLATPLKVQCHISGELLIEADVGDHLPSSAISVKGLDLSNADRSTHLELTRSLTAAGWRRERAAADQIAALEQEPHQLGAIEVVPVAIERWGRILRIAVALDGGGEMDDPPRWWAVTIGDHRVLALGEHFQSGRSADLIGHLVVVDPTSSTPVVHP